MSDGNGKLLRFQFSLRTLFIAAAMFGVVLFFYLWNVRQVAQRRELLLYIEQQQGYTMNATPKPWKRLPIVWHWLGAEPIGEIYLQSSKFSFNDREHVARMFPEASVFYIDHPSTR